MVTYFSDEETGDTGRIKHLYEPPSLCQHTMRGCIISHTVSLSSSLATLPALLHPQICAQVSYVLEDQVSKT